MTFKTNARLLCIPAFVALTLALLQFQASDAFAVSWGHMKADRILFLGNSVTLAGWYNGMSDVYWGIAASSEANDYVHRLTTRVNSTAGASLTVAPPTPQQGRWYYGDALPGWNGNILNMADVFERNFNTWDNARIQNQINASPDIVVLQIGENMANGTYAQFQTGLESLATALKNKSNPNIFITSRILGSDPTADAIKQTICAEDPSHRVFINLVGQVDVSGAYGHPNDLGMRQISDALYGAMLVHSMLPEPSSIAMVTTGLLAALAGACRRRRLRAVFGG
jgi:hypothetical protein